MAANRQRLSAKPVLTARAKLSNLDCSVRRIRPVLSLIRQRSVVDALVILEHTPKKVARPVKELVKSAAANAKKNHNLQPRGLVIDQIFATKGTSQPHRFTPTSRRLQGWRRRALPRRASSCHVFLTVKGSPRPTVTKKTSVNERSATATTNQPSAKTKSASTNGTKS